VGADLLDPANRLRVLGEGEEIDADPRTAEGSVAPGWLRKTREWPIQGSLL
jgi:hypothetical protein